MTVSVRLFARARDLVGEDVVELHVSDNATVRELRRLLGERYPALQPLLRNLFISVNEEYAQEGDTLPGEARIACFPPVSGG